MKNIISHILILLVLTALPLLSEQTRNGIYQQSLTEYQYDAEAEKWIERADANKEELLVNTKYDRNYVFFQDQYGKNFIFQELLLRPIYYVEKKTITELAGTKKTEEYKQENGRLAKLIKSDGDNETTRVYKIEDGILANIEYFFPESDLPQKQILVENDGKYITQESNVNPQSGDTITVRKFIRNDNDYVEKIEYYQIDDQSKTMALSHTQIYEYDDEGSLIAIRTEQGTRTSSLKFQYDEENKIKEILADQSHKFEIEYYPSGLYKQIVLSHHGTLISKTVYSLEEK